MPLLLMNSELVIVAECIHTYYLILSVYKEVSDVFNCCSYQYHTLHSCTVLALVTSDKN